MTIQTNQVVRATLTWNAPISTIAQNVFHFENQGSAISEATWLAACDTYLTGALANIETYIYNGYYGITVEGWKYNTITSKWEGIGVVASTAAGGASAVDPSAHGTCFVGRYVTAVPRRQGRTFVPGMIEDSIDSGLFDSAAMTAMGNYMAALVVGFTAGGQQQDLGTFNQDTTSIYYESFSAATGVALYSNVPGYQRRRKPGVGI